MSLQDTSVSLLHPKYAPLEEATNTLLLFVEKKKASNSVYKTIALLFERNRPQQQSALKKAIRCIQDYYRLINQLHCGSPEEQEFSTLIKRVVSEYNQVKDKQLPIITLPSFARHEETDAKENVPNVPTACNFTATTLGDRERDLYLMKVISTIHQGGLTTSRKALSTIVKTQLNVVKAQEETLAEQTFEPLPGEEISFKASFKSKAQSLTYRLSSHQTGFPDPALLAGITFPEGLIPQRLVDPNELWVEFLKDKSFVASALLPKGKYNSQAKNLYVMQKDLFSSKFDQLLERHQEILKALFPTLSFKKEDLNNYDEISFSYRQVDLKFEEMIEYSELSTLDGTFSLQSQIERLEEKKNQLPNSFSKDLLDHLWNFRNSDKLILMTIFQQLFFNQLLKQTLSQESLQKEIDRYLKSLQSLAQGNKVSQEAYQLLKTRIS